MGLHYRYLSESLDISIGHVQHLMCGTVRMSKKLARKIEILTEGEVKASDIRNEYPEDRRIKKKTKHMDFGEMLDSLAQKAKPEEFPKNWGKLKK